MERVRGHEIVSIVTIKSIFDNNKVMVHTVNDMYIMDVREFMKIPHNFNNTIFDVEQKRKNKHLKANTDEVV